MKTILYICTILLLSCSLAFSTGGTVPRLKADSYPNHAEINGVGIGAVLLRESDVKQRFTAKLSKDYLVVEAAVYPRKGEPVEVRPEDFVLRLSGTEIGLRPENPDVIAAALNRGGSPGRGVRVVPQAQIGIETGSRYPDPRSDPSYPGYDPTYDPRYDPRYRRPGGVYTSTGVGVILGDSGPGSRSRDQDATAAELSEKSLPGGPASKPVAGHLYFKVDKKTQQDPNNRFSLEVSVEGNTARVQL